LAERKRLEFNANLRDAQGTGVKKGIKLDNSGGVSFSDAVTGTMNSKTDGKLPRKTK
jgi:hypothetical protein